MKALSEAVILMAGSGSRLCLPGAKTLKPLVPVLGRPLISYTFEALVKAGIKRAYGVVGFEKELIAGQLQPLVPRELELRLIENPDWEKQNGISLLAAANHVSAPFLLTMTDHLFDQTILDLLLREHVPDRLNVAIDRKLDSIFDLDDAMKVKTRAEQIWAIGKRLAQYDAIDIGLFVCPKTIFDYLEAAKHNGDCSLAEGVQAMANQGKTHVIDIGDAWWQDIDTPEMRTHAEENLRGLARLKS